MEVSKRTIWKFNLTKQSSSHEVPIGSKLVHVGKDANGVPAVWLEVSPASPTEKRYFSVIGTGHSVPDGYDHVGTYLAEPFVWHIYERTV